MILFFFLVVGITILLGIIFDGVASRLLVQNWAMKVAEGRAGTTRRLLGTKNHTNRPLLCVARDF